MRFVQILLLSVVVLAQIRPALAGDMVAVGFKSGKAPFVMAQQPYKMADYDLDGRLGIEIEIVKEVFAEMGKTIKPVYMNFKRMPKAFALGQIDVGSNMQKGIDGAHYVGNFLRLHDVAIYQPSLGRMIDGLSDLKGLRVVAFQKAKIFLGDDYKAAIPTFASYREIDDQEKQIHMFYAGRMDILVSDISIFKHWSKTHGGPDKPYRTAEVLGDPFFFPIAFKSPKMAKTFETHLKELMASGRYDEIYATYLD